MIKSRSIFDFGSSTLCNSSFYGYVSIDHLIVLPDRSRRFQRTQHETWRLKWECLRGAESFRTLEEHWFLEPRWLLQEWLSLCLPSSWSLQLGDYVGRRSRLEGAITLATTPPAA